MPNVNLITRFRHLSVDVDKREHLRKWFDENLNYKRLKDFIGLLATNYGKC